MKRAAMYLRVSTGEQTTTNQRLELEAVAKVKGYDLVQVYEDAGVSGAKGRDKRPAFDAMIKDAVRRRFDILLVWSVDRLGRSLKALVDGLQELHCAGVDLYLHQQALDTTTPAGKAMFQMLGVFSEFERTMIRDRVKAGLERAKKQGKTLGRPKVKADADAVIACITAGKSYRTTAAELGLSYGNAARLAKGRGS